MKKIMKLCLINQILKFSMHANRITVIEGDYKTSNSDDTNFSPLINGLNDIHGVKLFTW